MRSENSGVHQETVLHSMRIHNDNWHIILLIVCFLFFCLFSLLGLWRHWGYLTSINDLGSFDQVVWMASRGHSLVNTSVLSMPMNWLGFHFQPILFAFVPLYKIIPSINWFVFAQSAALAVTAWPIFLFAERITASGKVAFMWSLAYLCNPFVLNAAAWDFHPVSISAPFIALGLLAVERKQMSLLLFVSLILLACKEHMGLAVAGLGLLYGIRSRAWAMGVGLFVTGIAAFVLTITLVMPSFSVAGQHPMFGENIEQLGRYSWLGESPAEVIKKILLEPVAVSKTVFVDLGGFDYIFKLMGPFLLLPIIALPWILPAAGDLIINLLSSVPLPRSLFSYHSVTIVPVLLVAAIHGSQKLTRYGRLFSSEKIATYILLMSLFLGYVHAPLPFPGSKNKWDPVNTIANYDDQAAIVRDVIGTASASVQANIGTHFSQRELIYRYPRKVGEADFVVLRLENPSISNQTLPHHLQMDPAEYLGSVSKLLNGEKYGVVFWDDPWLILRRGHKSSEHARNIRIKVENLREEWEVNKNEIAGQ